MNKVIRVLHTEWSDGWGGQEIRIVNEMIAVREQGVEVFLACRDHAIIKQKAIENNIKVFVLSFRGNADLKTLFSLRGIIKEYSIDSVNAHSGKDTWVGGLAAKSLVLNLYELVIYLIVFVLQVPISLMNWLTIFLPRMKV